MYGFKLRLYLDVSNETRRELWTLAHAQGTLLSLIHLAFSSLAARLQNRGRAAALPLCSSCLIVATVLIPAGFFLGGLFLHMGDPGIGVMLVPGGALLLLVGIFLAARMADSLGLPLESARGKKQKNVRSSPEMVPAGRRSHR